MRIAALAAALLAAAPVAAQVIPAVQLAHFNQQSSGTIPSATSLFSASVTPITGQGGGFMMLFSGKTVPPDGAVDPVACFRVDAGPNTTSLSMGAYPGSAPVGVAWAFSTGANCQIKVAATVNFVSIAYR